MENVLHWRRKLLDFDHPLHKPYVPIDIPRYYSSFYPWFRMFWNPECPRKDICTSTYHETLDYPTRYRLHNYPRFQVNWLLFVVILIVLFMTILSKK